jgi:hypothetical protein
MKKHKETKEAGHTKYYVRALKRITMVVGWLFVLFLVVMFVVWAVPKVWNWALG